MSEIKMSIRETPPVIKKVEMIENGRDGLKVTYATMEIRNSVASIIEINKKQKRPVQKELRVAFKALREHLLGTTGYPLTDKIKPILEENIIVTYVQRSEDEKFQIGGKNTVLGNYTIALNSPLVKAADYQDYDTLSELINTIFSETKMFMNGQKGADSRTVVIDYMMVKKENLNAEHDFEAMSKEEQDALMKEAMESYGLEVVEENGQKVLSSSEKVPVTEVPTQQVVSEVSEDEPEFTLPIDL